MHPYGPKRSKRAGPSNRGLTLAGGAGEADRDKGTKGQSGSLGGSIVGTICTPNQHLARPQFQHASPAQPSLTEWEWERGSGSGSGRWLQGGLDSYGSSRPTCASQWPPDRNGAGRLASSRQGIAFQSLQDLHLPAYPPPSNTQSTQSTQSTHFRYMMSDELQCDLPHLSRYQANSGSDDSQTLHGSYNASQDGTLDHPFDASGDLPYSYSSEAALGCAPVGEEIVVPPPRYTADYPQTSVTVSQDGQYTVPWQIRQGDVPWSHLNPFHENSPSLTRQPRMPHLPGEMLGCYDDGRIANHLASNSLYPPHISSPLTDAAWSLNEASLMVSESQWPETLPGHSEVPYVDDYMVFSDHTLSDLPAQSQGEREHSPIRYPQFSDHRSLPSHLWPPVNTPRTMQMMSRDQPSASQTMLRDNSYSDEPSRAFDNMLTRAQVKSPKKKNQASRKNGLSAPDTPLNAKWQNSIVSGGTFQELSSPEGMKKKGPGRIGPLPVESKKKAGEMRKRHACWRCWSLHQSCSPEQICSPCQISSFSLPSNICTRANLSDYTDLLFPALIVGRRQPSAVKLQIDENLTGFTNNQIKVSVSSGPGYPPILITVYEFLTRQDRANALLSCYYAPSNIHSPKPALERVYTPPLGIKDGTNDANLSERCQEHVRGLIKSSRFSKEATEGDASLISQKVYMAIDRYRNSGQISKNADQLLRKAVKLLAMNFFMSRVITFTKESAKEVVKVLRKPMQLPYGRRVSSKLLDNQIKQKMNLLQLALTREVLEGLQKELRTKCRESWGSGFCLILILSMCIEAVQVAADGFIVQTMIEANGTGVLCRDSTIEIIRPLDDRLFRDCVYIFHLMHRSRESIGDNRFNPIRDRITIDPTNSIDANTIQLVDDMLRIVGDHREHVRSPSTRNMQLTLHKNLN